MARAAAVAGRRGEGGTECGAGDERARGRQGSRARWWCEKATAGLAEERSGHGRVRCAGTVR